MHSLRTSLDSCNRSNASGLSEVQVAVLEPGARFEIPKDEIRR
jgi:hypothetical protein